MFTLVEAKVEFDGKRNVFKFFLQPIEKKAFRKERVVEHTRLVPTHVKIAVWKRDYGSCVLCGAKENLHFDHEIPFSKGGSSITVQNVRLLCAQCNISKGSKIMVFIPFLVSSLSVSRIDGLYSQVN